eukprot:scaffold2649_cov137-Cylindrotheca_fusiformis.AAC.10
MLSNRRKRKKPKPLFVIWNRRKRPPALYDELWWKWSRNLDAVVHWNNVLQNLSKDPFIAQYADEERQGMHLLHFICALHPPPTVVRATMDAYPQGRYTPSSNAGILPLMIACGRNASPAVLDELVANGAADTITMVDSNGFSAIHWACRDDVSSEVVQKLLEVDPSAASLTTTKDPMETLVQRDMTKLSVHQGQKLSLILRARYFTSIQLDPNSNSLLHAALALQVPRKFLEYSLQQESEDQKSVAKYRDCYGNLPLHYAVQRRVVEQPDMAEIMHDLISRIVVSFPEAVSLRNSCGGLPLHEALKNGYTWAEGVKILFDANPQANAILDPIDRVYPFCLAAMFPTNTENLDTSYSLLRENPEILVCYYDSEELKRIGWSSLG